MPLTKEQFDVLPEEAQALYQSSDDGYMLKPPPPPATPDPENDPGALRRAKDREVLARKEADAKLKAAEDKLATIDADKLRKAGDVDALEKSWEEKRAKEASEHAAERDVLNKKINKHFKDKEALKLATELALDGKAEALIPHIKQRLDVDTDGDDLKARVLDIDGKPSAATLEDLSKEFKENPVFSTIIKGSKASGSGANGNKGKGGSSAETMTLTGLNKLTTTEEVAFAKEHPERHKQLRS